MKRDNKVNFKVEEYSWGKLRKIEKGNSFTVVIHQEEWDQVQKVIDDSIEESEIKDESGQLWHVRKTILRQKPFFDKALKLESNKGRKITLSLGEVI